MKVLFANKFFYQKGGSETVMFQERDFLLNSKIDVVDFAMLDARNVESPYSDFFVNGVDYDSTDLKERLKTAFSFIHSKEAVAKIIKLVDAEKPDIAHLHNIYHQLTPSIIPALKKRGIKVVLTLHDTKLICPNYLSLCGEAICDECNGKQFYKAAIRNCQSSTIKSALLVLEAYYHKLKHSYEGVDRFIAPSRFLAEKIELGRPELGSVSVLHNGIDTEAIQPTWGDNGYILYLGRLSKEKGVPMLLKAHQSLKTKHPLKVVGTGPLLEPLSKRYPDVVFTGFKNGDELANLIADSSCVVVPSEWYENCSMVVLEAMAYGKPVIGSRIGGIPEQIKDGVTGCLFTMGDAEELASKLTMVMADRDLRIRMGRAARQRLEDKYSLDAHNEGLIRIYHEVLRA